MSPRDRKTADTAFQDYHLEGVPRALIQAAIAKCRRQDPPVSLRWLLQRLLSEWVSKD